MRFALAYLLLALSCFTANGGDQPRHIITWVPPYGTARTKAALTTHPEPASALTHLALQFWAPTAEGSVRRVTTYDKLPDDLVAEWRDWAHQHGLRCLLCIYNGESKWDWPLAQGAFAKNPEKFVAALVAEMEFHALDGIDLDLEGNGDFPADKAPFVAFVQRLSAELHQRGKQLFVDTFAYKWNAPNQTWWPELFPLVDGLSSMGYEETGSHSNGWRAYSAQATAAGAHVAKLQVGVPTHLDKWQENTALEHLAWFATTPNAPGLALWDAQFQNPIWRTPEPWALLKKLREAK
jgi:hypothetical protein